MQTDKSILDSLAEEAIEGRQIAHMRPVILKEILHYDILYCLEQANLLGNMVFQGGTSLRLCYGAPRYSEDLDFVAGTDYRPAHLASLKDRIEAYLGKRYGLEVTVKEPKLLNRTSARADVNVDRWQVAVITDPGRRDLPKQRIRIEVVNIPAYTAQVRKLNVNYAFLPDGYRDLLVVVESLDEIMADKLVSLAASQKYVRHRDIWDLSWLRQQGATVRPELVACKVFDYRIDDYSARLASMIERAPAIISGRAFKEEMKRFLPVDAHRRSLENPKFGRYLTGCITELYQELQSKLDSTPNPDAPGLSPGP